MKRLVGAGLCIGLALAGCGKDKDSPATSAATTTSTTQGVASPTAPPTTSKPVATTLKATTTTNAGDPPGLVPADSQTPAAGTCGNATNGIAAVTLNPDIPSPRCIIVADTDHLRVTNKFAVKVNVSDGSGGLFALDPGATDTTMKALGGFWATGVHRLRITDATTNEVLYGGSGPEVWLK